MDIPEMDNTCFSSQTLPEQSGPTAVRTHEIVALEKRLLRPYVAYHIGERTNLASLRDQREVMLSVHNPRALSFESFDLL